jgi:pyridine nucleotide-disulfide oxidoreductase family protein
VKRLVLLGGGHAHVHVLHALAQQPLPGVAAMLVTPFERQVYSGMVPGVVAGHYAPDEAVIPLTPLVRAAGVVHLPAAASALDANARLITLADGTTLGYDLLSVDTGAVMDRELIPGAREHALFVRPIEHFLQLLQRLRNLAAQRALDLVVVGGGAAGFELALALAHALGGRAPGELPDARVTLVTGGGEPLATYPPAVVARGLRALQRARVTVLRAACAAIESGSVVLEQGTRVACDAPLIAVGAAAPAWLRGSGLELDDHGFIATGPTLQSTSHANVFAAGDVATRVDAPHPKSGVYAVRAGPALVLNLRRALAGGELLPHRPQPRTLNLLSCGDRRAIASWGRWTAEGRWVWRWKDRIDRAFIARFGGGPGGGPHDHGAGAPVRPPEPGLDLSAPGPAASGSRADPPW